MQLIKCELLQNSSKQELYKFRERLNAEVDVHLQLFRKEGNRVCTPDLMRLWWYKNNSCCCLYGASKCTLRHQLFACIYSLEPNNEIGNMIPLYLVDQTLQDPIQTTKFNYKQRGRNLQNERCSICTKITWQGREVLQGWRRCRSSFPEVNVKVTRKYPLLKQDVSTISTRWCAKQRSNGEELNADMDKCCRLKYLRNWFPEALMRSVTSTAS